MTVRWHKNLTDYSKSTQKVGTSSEHYRITHLLAFLLIGTSYTGLHDSQNRQVFCIGRTSGNVSVGSLVQDLPVAMFQWEV